MHMEKDTINRIKEIKAKLQKSPLYAMSLGSMELFHSNFWQWLMRFNKEYIKVFFDDINIDNIKDEDIKREYKHTDIIINSLGKNYIIENKIKSLPDYDQLLKYENSIEPEQIVYTFPIDDECIKLNNEKWKLLTYDKIVSKINEITDNLIVINNKKIDSEYIVIKEYVNMTNLLIELIKESVEYSNRIYLAYTGDNVKLLDILHEIRLADVIKKINSNLLYNELLNRLEVEFGEEIKSGKLFPQVRFSNASALISVRWKTYYDENEKDKGYFLIGPQLQDTKFRSMIHVCTEHFGIKDVKNISDDQKNLIFEIVKESIFNDEYHKTRLKKGYNEYKGTFENKNYLCLYRYKLLNDYSFDTICKEFIKEIKKFKDVDCKKLYEKIKDKIGN